MKPICAEPRSASTGCMPPSTYRDVLEHHHDGIVDHETGGRSKPSPVEAEIPRYITPSVPTSDSGTARNDGARQRAQENEDHHHDEDDGESEIELDVGDRSAKFLGPIAQHADIDCRGSVDTICGVNFLMMRSTTWMMLAPGCR